MTKPVLHRYAYVRASQIDGVVSFEHCWLRAPNEEEAYRQGAMQLPLENDGRYLNDYVFLVEDAR